MTIVLSGAVMIRALIPSCRYHGKLSGNFDVADSNNTWQYVDSVGTVLTQHNNHNNSMEILWNFPLPMTADDAVALGTHHMTMCSV